MQSNVSSAAVARPHAHRAMSSSAAFSPLLHRQVFDSQASNFIRQPPSIREGNYPEAIGSARLQGQVVSPPPSGSSYGNHVDPASKERSRERDEKQKLRHTLSGSTSKEHIIQQYRLPLIYNAIQRLLRGCCAPTCSSGYVLICRVLAFTP